ncbi:MAG: NUDIX hydrolase [Planctomycetaceae bacterium]
MSDRYAWRGRFLAVRVDTPDRDGRAWEVVERPEAVAIVALTISGQVVLVRQWRQSVGRHTIEIPAGIVDNAESVGETAARELLEETGYRAARMTPIATLFASPGYSDERIHLVLATECVIEAGADLDGLTETFLVSRDDVSALCSGADNEPLDGKTYAGLCWLLGHWYSLIP